MKNEINVKKWEKPALTVISSAETTETVLWASGGFKSSGTDDEHYRQVNSD